MNPNNSLQLADIAYCWSTEVNYQMDFRMTCKSCDDWLVLVSPEHATVNVVHDQKQVLFEIFENVVNLLKTYLFCYSFEQ